MAAKTPLSKQETHNLYSEYANAVEPYKSNRTRFKGLAAMGAVGMLVFSVGTVAAANFSMDLKANVRELAPTSAVVDVLVDNPEDSELSYFLSSGIYASPAAQGTFRGEETSLVFSSLTPSTKYLLDFYAQSGFEQLLINRLSFITPSKPSPSIDEAKPPLLTYRVVYHLGDEANGRVESVAHSVTADDSITRRATVSEVEIKTFEGYTFSHIGATLPTSLSDGSVIDVYYTEDYKTLSVTVNYYVNNVYHSAKTIQRSVLYSQPNSLYVDALPAVSFPGCGLVSVSTALPASLATGSVINVYYESVEPSILQFNMDGASTSEGVRMTLVFDMNRAVFDRLTIDSPLPVRNVSQEVAGSVYYVSFFVDYSPGTLYNIVPRIAYHYNGVSGSISTQQVFSLEPFFIRSLNVTSQGVFDDMEVFLFDPQLLVNSAPVLGSVDSIQDVTLSASRNGSTIAQRSLSAADIVFDAGTGTLHLNDPRLSVPITEIAAGGDWVFTLRILYTAKDASGNLSGLTADFPLDVTF